MPLSIHTSGVPPQEQSISRERRINYSENLWIKVIDGERFALEAMMPPIGPFSSLPDCPLAFHAVVDVHYKPRDPAWGTLTIVCAAGTNVVYEEVDVGMITRKIEYHERYRDQLTSDDMWLVETLLNSNSNDTFATFKGQLDAAAPLVKELWDFRSVGVDSYLEPAPVARRTTFLAFALGTANHLGQIQTPTFSTVAIPLGYKWLVTADRLIMRPGFLEHVEEWTGAVYWPPELYP